LVLELSCNLPDFPPDTKIQLCDLRFPEKPLHTFAAHCGQGLRRLKSIYHPLFIANGKAIVACAEKCESLVMYSTVNGATLSRGFIGFDPTAMQGFPSANTQTMAVARAGVVYLYSPLSGDDGVDESAQHTRSII